MDAATRPVRFKTDEEWRAWKHDYQAAYWALNKERRRLVSLGQGPKLHKSHAKKRRM